MILKYLLIFIFSVNIGIKNVHSYPYSCHYTKTKSMMKVCLIPLQRLTSNSLKRGIPPNHYAYPTILKLDHQDHSLKRRLNNNMIHAEVHSLDEISGKGGSEWRVPRWVVVTYNEISSNISSLNSSLELLTSKTFENTISNESIIFFLNVFSGSLSDVEDHLTLQSANVYMIFQDKPISMYDSFKKTQHINIHPIKKESKKNIIPYAETCRSGSVNGMTAGYFSWGIDTLDQTSATLDSQFCVEQGNDGTGMHAYIVDSGVNQHTSFSARLHSDFDYYNTRPFNPHGTHVAGLIGSTIYGVTTATTLHDIRILDENGSGSFSSLLAGLLWIAQNGVPGVINLSLGVLNAYSNPVASVMQDLTNAGYVFVVAAGNDNVDGCYSFPANVPNVLTVGAYQIPRAKASFSNYGNCVDLYSPGVSIISTFGNNSETIMSGTSMACPIAAGVAVTVKQNYPAASSNTIINRVISNSLSNIITGLNSQDHNVGLHYVAPDAPTPTPTPVTATGDFKQSHLIIMGILVFCLVV